MTKRLEKPHQSDPLEPELDGIVRAVHDEATQLLDRSIADILGLMREHLIMDIVFVARCVGDIAVISHVDAVPGGTKIEGTSHLWSESFCQRVLDGRLPSVMPDVAALRKTHEVPEPPIPIGAYMAAPVWLQDGSLTERCAV